MGRDQYRISDDDVAAEFERVCQLFQLAMGKPSERVLFEALMGEANEQGLNWVEGLEYVLEQRQPEPSRRPVQPARFGEALRRAS